VCALGWTFRSGVLDWGPPALIDISRKQDLNLNPDWLQNHPILTFVRPQSDWHHVYFSQRGLFRAIIGRKFLKNFDPNRILENFTLLQTKLLKMETFAKNTMEKCQIYDKIWLKGQLSFESSTPVSDLENSTCCTNIGHIQMNFVAKSYCQSHISPKYKSTFYHYACDRAENFQSSIKTYIASILLLLLLGLHSKLHLHILAAMVMYPVRHLHFT